MRYHRPAPFSAWVICALAVFVALWTGVRVFSAMPPRQHICCEPCLCPGAP